MVVQLLWKFPGISRIDIARKLNLYRSTVSNIINILIDNQVVVEEEEGSATPQGGRKPIHLSVNKNFGCVVGLELQPTGYHGVIVDMSGTVVYKTFDLLPDLPFDEIIDAVMSVIIPEVNKTGLPLLAVNITLPGIIDSKSRQVLLSHPFGLKNHSISQELFRTYGVPFFVENDANCLAWLELSQNRNDLFQNFICINVEEYQKVHRLGEYKGVGIGIGVAIDGSVYSGNKNAAGEFLTASWKGDHIGQTGLSAKNIKTVKTDEDAFAELVVDLFISLVSVISVLNPEIIFLYGELASRFPLVKKIIDEQVPQFNILLQRTSCRLECCGDSDFAAATGAAMMYFLHLFSISGQNSGRFKYDVDWDAIFALSRTETQSETRRVLTHLY